MLDPGMLFDILGVSSTPGTRRLYSPTTDPETSASARTASMFGPRPTLSAPSTSTTRSCSSASSGASRTVFRYPRVEQPGASCIYEFFNFFPEVLRIFARQY